MTSQLVPAAIFDLCYDCAQSIYSTRPPSTRYADLTARLLFGTAVHESAGLAHSRQLGFSHTDPRGAWSYWQLQWGSIWDSLLLLRANNPLARNVALFLDVLDPAWHAHFLRLNEHNGPPLLSLQLAFLNLVQTWPRLAVVLARLHYIRFPEPIPASISDQAAYWKQIYNTPLGKGSPAEYITSWDIWATPAIHNFNSRPNDWT